MINSLSLKFGFRTTQNFLNNPFPELKFDQGRGERRLLALELRPLERRQQEARPCVNVLKLFSSSLKKALGTSVFANDRLV